MTISLSACFIRKLRSSVVLLLLAHLVFPGVMSAASPQGRLVTGVVVVGNERTHEQVIRREMSTTVGDFFDSARVEQDRKRIQNLGLFTRVEIVAAPAPNDHVTLVVLVAERWHFFPYPLVYRNERSWDKWSYGAGLIHNNVGGWNRKLLGEAWMGYNPGGQFLYVDPWFGGDAHFFGSLKLQTMTVRSRALDQPRFEEKRRGAALVFGKQWGFFTSLSASLAYESLGYPEAQRHLLPSKSAHQHLPSFGVNFRYDRRDLYEYPRSGWYLNVYGVEYYFPRQMSFFLYGVDCRSYFPLHSAISLALRFNMDLSAGKVPIFGRRYLGYLERVRGRFFERREGENLALASAELRFPLLPIRYIDLSGGLLDLGKYQRDLPFGVSGAVFIDAGDVWWNAGGDRGKSLAGYGAGLHVHLPYIELLRIEYAFSLEGRPQWIIDLLTSF